MISEIITMFEKMSAKEKFLHELILKSEYYQYNIVLISVKELQITDDVLIIICNDNRKQIFKITNDLTSQIKKREDVNIIEDPKNRFKRRRR